MQRPRIQFIKLLHPDDQLYLLLTDHLPTLLHALHHILPLLHRCQNMLLQALHTEEAMPAILQFNCVAFFNFVKTDWAVYLLLVDLVEG